MAACPTVPFLLESCAGRPFDPTVLAPSRMSELQPHLPTPLPLPPCPCIFRSFENCGGSGQRGVASACLETGRASGNSDAGVSSCRCPFRGLCWTTGSGQSRGVTPARMAGRNRLSSRKDLAAGVFIGRKEISSFIPSERRLARWPSDPSAGGVVNNVLRLSVPALCLRRGSQLIASWVSYLTVASSFK